MSLRAILFIYKVTFFKRYRISQILISYINFRILIDKVEKYVLGSWVYDIYKISAMEAQNWTLKYTIVFRTMKKQLWCQVFENTFGNKVTV